MKKQGTAKLEARRIWALLFGLAMALSVASSPAQAQFIGCENPSQQTNLLQQDCLALVALYNATDGDNWTNNTNWLQTSSPCSWFGVSCTGGRVTTLALAGNNLNGMLPPEIGDLTALQQLFLVGNNLMGSIPTTIGNLTSLTQFLAGDNNLSGNLPTQLGDLTNLAQLWLFNNNLTGPFPAAMGDLANLNSFLMANNQLGDPVPLPVAVVGAAASTCSFTGNDPSLCFPDTPEYQALADAANQICGLTLDPTCSAVTVFTEGLGTPTDITIADGSGFVAAGTGMVFQPGTINLTIPAGATVQQVLLYWSGQDRQFPLGEPLPQGDNTIEVSNTGGAPFTTVIGTLIGGPTTIFQENPQTNVINTVFRADITGLGLVGAGANTLTVQGLDFERASNGAGLLVIIGGGPPAEISLREGQDWAFGVDPDPLLNSMVPQTFSFAAAPFTRTATVPMFFGSVAGMAMGGQFRPTSIDVVIDEGLPTESPAVVDVTGADLSGSCGVFRDDDESPISDLLNGCDGPEWDTVVMEVTIPAGATTLTVHPLSRDDNPGDPANFVASFTWVAAGLAVPEVQAPPSIDIRKQAEGPDRRVFPAGSDVVFEVVVANTGSVPLNGVVVTDVLAPDCDRDIGFLAAGDSFMYECTAPNVTEGFTNEACVEGSRGGVTVDDCDPSTVLFCGECEGKVTELTLRYDGAVIDAFILVTRRAGPVRNQVVFAGVVQPRQEFSFVGLPGPNPGFAGTLGTEIQILVNGRLNTKIHTSCSQPIGPGLVSGDFTVVAGASKHGGPLCPLHAVTKRSGDGLPEAPDEDAQALEAVPTEFSLEVAYPNPFNPETTIRFSLPEASDVRLVVYDMLGRRVQVLAEGSYGAGRHAVRFEGSALPSGTYIYRIDTAFGTATRMMVLTK